MDGMRTLKEMVIDNKKVVFSHYTQGELWYTTETGFTFPVAISDTGNATFKAEDKAIYFMRYIRRHLDTISSARESGGNPEKL